MEYSYWSEQYTDIGEITTLKKDGYTATVYISPWDRETLFNRTYHNVKLLVSFDVLQKKHLILRANVYIPVFPKSSSDLAFILSRNARTILISETDGILNTKNGYTRGFILVDPEFILDFYIL